MKTDRVNTVKELDTHAIGDTMSPTSFDSLKSVKVLGLQEFFQERLYA